MTIYVKDLLTALDDITNGRCIKTSGDYANNSNPFVVTKTSGVPGKAITELPGLVWGNPEREIKKIAVLMTLTESAIELAGATGVDAIVCHHPVAEGASSGGVLFKYYFGIYNLAVFELHEAFHGTHPGTPWLHCHKPYFTSIDYGNNQGNVVHVGEVLPEIKTLGDLLDQLESMMDVTTDEKMLIAERKIRNSQKLEETSIKVRGKILVGHRNNPIKEVIHMFPHTGFNVENLEQLLDDFPNIDTLIASTSRYHPGHELIVKAEEMGLNFICGNSHAMEIYENGVPLAYAIRNHLPEAEVVIFRERMSSIPLDEVGSPGIREYGRNIAETHLKRNV